MSSEIRCLNPIYINIHKQIPHGGTERRSIHCSSRGEKGPWLITRSWDTGGLRAFTVSANPSTQEALQAIVVFFKGVFVVFRPFVDSAK